MTVESLKAFGADTDKGLERCMGMEDFYIEMVELGISNEQFEALGPFLEEGNLEEAFEAAHALKGVVGNLELTPLYETICELTEHLRSKDAMDYKPLYDKLMSQRQAIRDLP